MVQSQWASATEHVETTQAVLAQIPLNEQIHDTYGPFSFVVG